MKHLRSLLALPLAALAASCSDDPSGPLPTAPPAASSSAAAVEVDSQAELQAALDAPLAGPSVRVVRLAADVTLASTLTYAGPQELRIEGRGATITGPAGGDALTVTGGADLILRDVTIAGAGGHGVYVDVPAGAAGTVDVALHGVTLRDNGLSGLWVEDQEHASPAGVSLAIRESRIERNGFRAGAGFADFDGVRVNEGGAGDLELDMHRVVVTGNAADGVELDEKGAGDVAARVQHTVFDDNGDQPQNPDDLEDGFDVDEAGAGDIRARLTHVRANGNEDEGIDLDEEGTGGIEAVFNQVEASRNLDSNITLTEDEGERAGGSVELDFHNVTASGSRDDDGIKVEEFGAGDLEGRIVSSTIAGNADDGIQVEENQAGRGTLRLQSVLIRENGDDPVNADDVTVVQTGTK